MPSGVPSPHTGRCVRWHPACARSGAELALQRRAKAGDEAYVAEPGPQFRGLRLDGVTRLRAHIGEQAQRDLALLALGPPAHDLAVPPDRRAGVAVAVEQPRTVRAQVPVALAPAHHRRIEAWEQRSPWL